VETLCSASEKLHATSGTAVKFQDYAQPRKIFHSAWCCAVLAGHGLGNVFRNLHISGDDDGFHLLK
jgi:hypothetical protein